MATRGAVLNKQKPVSYSGNEGSVIVHHMFPTIQGEGPLTGRPALFVRLWGCNLRCPACDEEYTSMQTEYTIKDLVKKICLTQKELIVITGGEPFRQESLGDVVYRLTALRRTVQIETNGTLWTKTPALYKNARIVVSPKAHTVAIPETFIEAVKYVVHSEYIDHSDGLPIISLGRKTKPLWRPSFLPPSSIYLQPEDTKNEEQNKKNLDACIDSCIKHGYTLNVQLHKIIGLE